MATPTVASITTYLTNSLLLTVIEDLAIEEHRLACRRRAEASLYRTPSGAVSSNGFLAPSGSKVGSGSGPSPSKKEKDDALYDCMNCTRTIAAPRYASHLSGCMGLGGAGGTRRGESRRQAALASNGSGKATNGLTKLGIERAASVSSCASDEDAMSGVDKKLILKLPSFNQNKRSASTPASGASKPKKPRPAVPPAIQHAAPHLTSHPLSKTLSAPIPSVPAPHKTHQMPFAAPPISATMVARPSLPTVPPPKAANLDDRPDSDSSAEEDSADEKPRQPIAPRAPGPTKMPHKSLPFGRAKHPLARGAESSGSDSGSDGSASD